MMSPNRDPPRGGSVIFRSVNIVKVIQKLDTSINESLMLELMIKGKHYIFLLTNKYIY